MTRPGREPVTADHVLCTLRDAAGNEQHEVLVPARHDPPMWIRHRGVHYRAVSYLAGGPQGCGMDIWAGTYQHRRGDRPGPNESIFEAD